MCFFVACVSAFVSLDIVVFDVMMNATRSQIGGSVSSIESWTIIKYVCAYLANNTSSTFANVSKEKDKHWVINFWRHVARVSLPQITIIGTANAKTKKASECSKTNSLGIFECKINSVVNWKRRTQAIQQFKSLIAEGIRSSEPKVVHRLNN